MVISPVKGGKKASREETGKTRPGIKEAKEREHFKKEAGDNCQMK